MVKDEFHKIRQKYLKVICIFSSISLIVIGIYNYSRGFKLLAITKFILALFLVAAVKLMERFYHFTAYTVIAFLAVISIFMIRVQAFYNIEFLSMWYPIFVFIVSFIENYIAGTLFGIFIVLTSVVIYVKSGFAITANISFYWLQLVISTALTLILYFAMFEVWKKYEELLIERAEVDYLTGLFSRAKILEILEHECEKASRYGFPLCVAMIDLDNFKVVNDTKGHIYGDEVLKKIATAIKESIRRIDYCGRYGGDEFIVVAPHTDANGAVALAERIRRKVEELNLGVTASVGVVPYIYGMPMDKIISEADRVLYEAKSQGRNQVVLARPKLS